MPTANKVEGSRGVVTGHPRPIDLKHLSQQTMGDRSVEQEVLKLFRAPGDGGSRRYTGGDRSGSPPRAHLD